MTIGFIGASGLSGIPVLWPVVCCCADAVASSAYAGDTGAMANAKHIVAAHAVAITLAKVNGWCSIIRRSLLHVPPMAV